MRAFSLLRDGLTQSARGDLQLPRLDVYRDQIVWGRSAVRIDVAGYTGIHSRSKRSWSSLPNCDRFRSEPVAFGRCFLPDSAAGWR